MWISCEVNKNIDYINDSKAYKIRLKRILEPCFYVKKGEVMTNFQNYILESLTEHAMSFTDEEKANCLINHYEKNIEFYGNVVEQGFVHSPAEIVDRDYYNLNMILFYNMEDVDMEKIKEVREYFNNSEDIYFEEDSANGNKYLYSLTLPILKNFTKDELLAKDIDEEMEF